MSVGVPSPSIAATRVAASPAATQNVVMLHGIYGRGRNWQAVARRLVDARPDYGCWLVDLPYHGGSGPSAHGPSVAGLAADVSDWATRQGIAPRVILGHSYGGKVSLAMADRARTRELQVWVIDSTPEAKSSSGSAWNLLRIVRALPGRFETRADAVAGIVAGGFPLAVAQWMATNLERDGDGFVWRLDFDVMDQLLQDFFTTDLWPVVEHPEPHEIHFLKASQSSALSANAVKRLTATPSSRVHLHHREGGHWIHAESPDVVTALLLEHLPRI